MDLTTVDLTTVDLFGGPGGWAEGLRAIGQSEVGIERDSAACATRRAAGHRVIRADVARTPCGHLARRIAGLIASAPCPLFSTAGKQAGRRIMTELREAAVDALAGIDSLARHRTAMAAALERAMEDRLGRILTITEHEQCEADAAEAALSAEPARWIAETQPRWIALEQVPAVLPLWARYAHELATRHGYSTWAGILNAADYGVPQTRRRAILIASLDHRVGPPPPTHCRGGADTLFGRMHPWVSMAQALGWLGEDDPARTLAGNRHPRWLYPDNDGTHGRMVGFPRNGDRGTPPDQYRPRDWRPDSEPAPAITEKAQSMMVCTGNNSTVAGGVVKYERPVTEPSPTLTGNVGRGWRLNPGRTDSQPKRNPRPIDEPAPTVAFGHDSASWAWERPATTLQGDPRVFTPGGHIANDGRDNARMKGRSEDAIRLSLSDALILQSFHPDYPVQGNRTKQFEQVGNAVPPLLAAHVLAVATGTPLEVS